MLAQVLATFLIALAASPFTAPFSSCAVADLFREVATRGRHEALDASASASVADAGNVETAEVRADVRPEEATGVAGPACGPVLYSVDDIAHENRGRLLALYDRACPSGVARPPSVLRL
ncbi:MAG: hypothetical protein ABL986_17460 [Vicinamibacterales bacterium]